MDKTKDLHSHNFSFLTSSTYTTKQGQVLLFQQQNPSIPLEELRAYSLLFHLYFTLLEKSNSHSLLVVNPSNVLPHSSMEVPNQIISVQLSKYPAADPHCEEQLGRAAPAPLSTQFFFLKPLLYNGIMIQAIIFQNKSFILAV